jgi:hypothetical protein
MNNEYRLIAVPKFIEVACPKHRRYMVELDNGFFGNPVWWCAKCDYPYELKLTKMRQFDRQAVDKQLAQKEPQ